MPITSANLTFQEFLCHTNKVIQISDAKNALKKIPGNSLQSSSKKRRLTYATSANEPSLSISIGYQKPKTYQEFLRELTLACKQGDNDSKWVMEKLVPHLVKHLKLTKQWDSPSHGLSTPDEVLSLISSEQEFRDVKSLENAFDEIISLHLDKNCRGESSSDTTIDDNDETSWQCASESTPISSADISVLECDSFHSTHASTEVDSVSTDALTVSESAGSNSCKHSDTFQDSESLVVERCQHMHMAASSSSNSTMIGSLHCTSPICKSTDVHTECNGAICNLLMDIDLERFDGAMNPTKHASTVLKHLQPYREKPSKDRGKRFHCGSTLKNQKIMTSNCLSFGLLSQPVKYYAMHNFFIGQIIGMMDSEKSCNFNLSSNKNLQIMFEIFKYDFTTMSYASEGRTGLLQGCKHLFAGSTPLTHLEMKLEL